MSCAVAAISKSTVAIVAYIWLLPRVNAARYVYIGVSGNT